GERVEVYARVAQLKWQRDRDRTRSERPDAEERRRGGPHSRNPHEHVIAGSDTSVHEPRLCLPRRSPVLRPRPFDPGAVLVESDGNVDAARGIRLTAHQSGADTIF